MFNLPKDMLQAAQARAMEFQNHASETLRIEHKLQTSIASIKQKLALNSKKDAICVNCTRLHQQVSQKVQDAVSKDYTIRALQREIEDLKTQNRIIAIKNNTQKGQFKKNNESEMHRPHRLDSKERKKTISQIYHIPDKLAEEETQLKQIQEKASLLKYKQKRERMLIKRLNSNSKRSVQSIPYAVINLHESQASQSLKSYQPMSSSFYSQDCQPQVVQNLSGFSNANQASKKVYSRSPEIEIKSEKSLNDPFQKVEGAFEQLRRENQLLKRRCQTLETDNNTLKLTLKQQELKHSSLSQKLQTELSQIKHELKQKTQQISLLNNKIQNKLLEQQLLNKKIRNLSNELQRQILFSQELQQQVKIQSQMVCQKADLNFKLGEEIQNLKYACKEEELRHLQTRRMLQAQEEENRYLREQNNQIKNMKETLEEQLVNIQLEIQKQRQLNREISEANNKKIKESFDQTLRELSIVSESKETKIKCLEEELMGKDSIIHELQRANNQFEVERSRFLSQIQQQNTQKKQFLIQKQVEIKSKNDQIQHLQHMNNELTHQKQQIFTDLQRNIQFVNQIKQLQQIYVNQRNQTIFQKQQLEQKCQSLGQKVQELVQQSLKHKEKEAIIISLENSKRQAEERMALLESELSQAKKSNEALIISLENSKRQAEERMALLESELSQAKKSNEAIIISLENSKMQAEEKMALLESELSQAKKSNEADKDNQLKIQKDLALLRKQFNDKISEVNNLKEEQQKILAAKDKELEYLSTVNQSLQEKIKNLQKRIEQIEDEDNKSKAESIEKQTKNKEVEKGLKQIRQNLEKVLVEKDQCIENLKREIDMTTNSYHNMMEMKEEQIQELKKLAENERQNKQKMVFQKQERQKQVASLRQLQATLKQELIEKQLSLKNLRIQVGNIKALFQAQIESHKESLKLKQQEFLRQRESLRAQNQSIRQKIVTLQSQVLQEHSQKLKYLSNGQEAHEKLMKNITLLEAENKSKEQKTQELENLQKTLQEEYQGYREQTSKQLKMKQEKITSYERKIQTLEQQQVLQRNSLKVKETEFESLRLSNDAIITNKELQISELLVQKQERQKQVASLRQLQATLKQELIEKQLSLKNLRIQVGNIKALFQAQIESHKESLKLKQTEFEAYKQSLKLQIHSMKQFVQAMQKFYNSQYTQFQKLQNQSILLKQTLKAKDQQIQHYQAQYFTLKLQCSQLQRQNQSFSHTTTQSSMLPKKLQALQHQNLLQQNLLAQKTIQCTRTFQYKQQTKRIMPQLLKSAQHHQIKQVFVQSALNEKDQEIIQLKKHLSDKDQRIRELSSKLVNLLRDSPAPQKSDSQVLYTFVQSQQLIQQNKIEEELEKWRAQFKELQPKIAKSEHQSSIHRLPLDLQTPIKDIDDQHEIQQKPKSDKPNILQTKDIRDVLSHSQEEDFHYQLQQKRQSSQLFGSRSQHGTYLGASIISNTSNRSAVESQKEYASKMKQAKFLAKLNSKKKK